MGRQTESRGSVAVLAQSRCPPPTSAPLLQVFISKDLAQHFGYRSAPEALRGLRSRVQPGYGGVQGCQLGQGGTAASHTHPSTPSAILICAWAEEGADAIGPGGELVHSDAFPPETLVDTLGAGDTFNAAVIFALSAGECVAQPQNGHGSAQPQHSHSSAWPGPAWQD